MQAVFLWASICAPSNPVPEGGLCIYYYYLLLFMIYFIYYYLFLCKCVFIQCWIQLIQLSASTQQSGALVQTR